MRTGMRGVRSEEVRTACVIENENPPSGSGRKNDNKMTPAETPNRELRMFPRCQIGAPGWRLDGVVLVSCFALFWSARVGESSQSIFAKTFSCVIKSICRKEIV